MEGRSGETVTWGSRENGRRGIPALVSPVSFLFPRFLSFTLFSLFMPGTTQRKGSESRKKRNGGWCQRKRKAWNSRGSTRGPWHAQSFAAVPTALNPSGPSHCLSFCFLLFQVAPNKLESSCFPWCHVAKVRKDEGRNRGGVGLIGRGGRE